MAVKFSYPFDRQSRRSRCGRKRETIGTLDCQLERTAKTFASQLDIWCDARRSCYGGHHRVRKCSVYVGTSCFTCQTCWDGNLNWFTSSLLTLYWWWGITFFFASEMCNWVRPFKIVVYVYFSIIQYLSQNWGNIPILILSLMEHHYMLGPLKHGCSHH